MSKELSETFINRCPKLSRRLHVQMKDPSFGPQTYFELTCVLKMKKAKTLEAYNVGSAIKVLYPHGYRWLRHLQEGLATYAYEDYGELKELNSLFGPVLVAGEYVDALDKEYNDTLIDKYRKALLAMFYEEENDSDE